MSGKYSMSDPIWEEISDSAKGLIHQMLDINQDSRVSARDALQHPWFQNASKVQISSNLMKEALDNLRGFSATQKLQQATLSMMVQNMVSKEEQGKLQ